MNSSAIRYIRSNLDELMVMGSLAKIAFDRTKTLSELDMGVLAAVRRSSPAMENASVDEIAEYLSAMDDQQIAGFANNIKGILHEMEFVALENGDGDTVYATLFSSTNHPGKDVILFDEASLDTVAVQLKATDNIDYVRATLESLPDEEVLVTSEVAQELGLQSSGVSNTQVTVATRDFVEQLLELDDDSNLWSHFPLLAPASIAAASWEIWRRFRTGEIDASTMRRLATRTAVVKTGKVTLYVGLLAIPGINVVVGALLTARLIFGVQVLADTRMDFHVFRRKVGQAAP